MILINFQFQEIPSPTLILSIPKNPVANSGLNETFNGHPVIRIIRAFYNNCTMLRNVSSLKLRARRRTLGCIRDITRARLFAGPMSNRRARGMRVWSLAITRTPSDPRPHSWRHEGLTAGWTNKQLARVWTEGVDPIRKKHVFEYIQIVSKRFCQNRVNL